MDSPGIGCRRSWEYETTDMIVTELGNRTSSDLHRNSSLAHLLHLAVKDAIKESSFVTTICKRVTEFV